MGKLRENKTTIHKILIYFKISQQQGLYKKSYSSNNLRTFNKKLILVNSNSEVLLLLEFYLFILYYRKLYGS